MYNSFNQSTHARVVLGKIRRNHTFFRNIEEIRRQFQHGFVQRKNEDFIYNEFASQDVSGTLPGTNLEGMVTANLC